MVIEPESLIFFSVPSWAAAAAEKPSAAAASTANAVFIVVSLRVIEKLYLVQRRRGIAQPLGHGREQRDAESWLGLDQVQEHVAVDGEQRAVGLGHGVRRARRLVDERHLAEDAARTDALDHRAADRDRYPSFDHHVH